MPDQYDAVGGDYEGTLALPAMAAMRRAMVALAGDVAGLDVLDVATGTGVHARSWAAAGARRVVGFDKSTGMVAAARRIERARPAGITYHAADAVDRPVFGSFDLVTAGFLLNYARDETTMTTMARTLHDNVRPGGRLIGMLPHPDYRFGWAESRRYGFDYTARETIGIGTVMRITLYGDPPVTFESVLARREFYEAALVRAGFAPPRWVPLHVPDPARPDPELDGLADNPPAILYETSRPG